MWDFIDDYCFGITLNANDTFAYGCADSVYVHKDDIPKLLYMKHKYGSQGVLAMMAKINKQEPIKPRQTEEYFEAKKELETYILSEDLIQILDDKVAWDKWWKEFETNELLYIK